MEAKENADMPDGTVMNWPIIRDVDWPHGVRCMDCRTPLTEGDPYIERMEGFVEETPTTEVVCLTCGGGLCRVTPLP